ncbi:hypothetical protein RvY_10098-1 [Ramazzottius varieornatus]|uniref:Uncharacterized protein n=1 Tax=Ramazzottius varieornatus TaxID=947166 RepID=A0A1D1VJE6_RAMVA|nr:hypothetical protein RvY_10098-1 [Ramazzottius varieornatus]
MLLVSLFTFSQMRQSRLSRIKWRTSSVVSTALKLYDVTTLYVMHPTTGQMVSTKLHPLDLPLLIFFLSSAKILLSLASRQNGCWRAPHQDSTVGLQWSNLQHAGPAHRSSVQGGRDAVDEMH